MIFDMNSSLEYFSLKGYFISVLFLFFAFFAEDLEFLTDAAALRFAIYRLDQPRDLAERQKDRRFSEERVFAAQRIVRDEHQLKALLLILTAEFMKDLPCLLLKVKMEKLLFVNSLTW